MTEGFIQITEPILCKKDGHIILTKDSRNIICIVKGKFINSNNNSILGSGEVFGLSSILYDKYETCDLIALEDSAVIEINNKNIENILKRNPELIKDILSDTVCLIREMGDVLI